MTDHQDGMALARERIAREAEEKTGFLDLGSLGLTELPEELFGLTQLREIICAFNEISDLQPLAGLTSLQSLNCRRTQISDRRPRRADVLQPRDFEELVRYGFEAAATPAGAGMPG